MVNFIICDDNKAIKKHVEDIIDKTMMKNKISYTKYSFLDYDKDFFHILKEELTAKIYILDIETPSNSGVEIARKIRQRDIDSVIIFLTSHEELGYSLIHDELMFLTFICKFNEMDKRLESAIRSAIKMVGMKQAIRFQDHGIIYTIPLNDIFYVTTNTVDRKTIIVTNYNEFKVSKTLSEISESLDDRFKQTHRSCYINMNKVIKIDKRNNEITFDNRKKIYMLSDTYKKELVVNG